RMAYEDLSRFNIDAAHLEKTGLLSREEVLRLMARPESRKALNEAMGSDPRGAGMLQAAVAGGKSLNIGSFFETHANRNVIGNALGVRTELHLEGESVRMAEVQKGDVAFAVSDGVLDNLGSSRMKAAARAAKSPQELMDLLAAESERIA